MAEGRSGPAAKPLEVVGAKQPAAGGADEVHVDKGSGHIDTLSGGNSLGGNPGQWLSWNRAPIGEDRPGILALRVEDEGVGRDRRCVQGGRLGKDQGI